MNFKYKFVDYKDKVKIEKLLDKEWILWTN